MPCFSYEESIQTSLLSMQIRKVDKHKVTVISDVYLDVTMILSKWRRHQIINAEGASMG